MSDRTTRAFDELPLPEARRVDAVCVAFEKAWRRNEQPQIEDYLAQVVDGARSTLFRHLCTLEVDLRRTAGDTPEPSEYHARFRDLRSEIEEAFESQDQEIAPAAGLLSDKLRERFRIERALGAGGFGKVYLAVDLQLGRRVALKMPRVDRFRSDRERQHFVNEARTAARLEHPGIVPVYDVLADGQSVVIVQQYIQGRDLNSADLEAFLKLEPVSPRRVAELMATIADTMAFAHRQGYIHRDLKPSNILIDQQGRPYVADFGLALHATAQRELRGERSGTPAYMSPEQVRGETHRLNQRSDIWSLGVILYEMLAGRRPFEAASRDELFDAIQHRPPMPLLGISTQISAELDRICLKCLSKRAADRYADADELKEDLRHWLHESSVATAANMEQEAHIDPKGLRCFDVEDGAFFLRLLPGVRDRQGLPESVRFWKTRIETADPELAFSVGLIYGPSGCGKSSLLRAGLLPRLASHVIPIYVEATKADTELRILRRLRPHCPEIPDEVGLPDVFRALREGVWIPPGKKLLVILDQFEQWLQAKTAFEDTSLAQALRQCDGRRLQTLLLVRDDFWSATSRFMQAIEIALVEGRNCRLVDLFEPQHARQVLAEFGRAYGRLPSQLVSLTREQEAFLDQSVKQLEQDGRVICVRLALLAEMMKHRPWNVASLREAGGAEGLGVAFLDEMLSSPPAPAPHRAHQEAAKAVLAALLPEPGSQIKGRLRSHAELRQASGYESQPRDFDALLQMLDQELRLITPAESAHEAADQAAAGTADGHYQLTHDYLVPSVREWLSRKQRETRRGRAEIRLAERAVHWSQRREIRRLPSLPEFLNILCYTRHQNWTATERDMLRRARRYYLAAATVLLVVLGFIGWLGFSAEAKRQEARQQTEENQRRAEENERLEAERLKVFSYMNATSDAKECLKELHILQRDQVLAQLGQAAKTDIEIRDELQLRSLATQLLTRLGVGPKQVLPGTDGFEAACLACSPDGRYLAVGGTAASKCAVRLLLCELDGQGWDLWMQDAAPDEASNGIRALAFSPDGHWLAAGTSLGYMQVWDLHKLPALTEVSGAATSDVHTAPARVQTVPPNAADSQTPAEAGLQTPVVAGLRTEPPHAVPGNVAASWKAHLLSLSGLQFSPDSSLLCSVSQDKTLVLWDTSRWEKVATHELPAEPTTNGVVFHPSKNVVICGNNAGFEKLQLHDLEIEYSEQNYSLAQVCLLSPDSPVVAVTQILIRLFDIDTEQDSPAVQRFGFPVLPEVTHVNRLVAGERGTILAGTSLEDRFKDVIRFWSAIDGSELGDISVPSWRDLTLTPDGELLVLQENQVLSYQLTPASEQVEVFLGAQNEPVDAVDISPNSEFILTAAVTKEDRVRQESTVRLAVWKTSGELVATQDVTCIWEHLGYVRLPPSAQFSPDGHTVGVGYGGQLHLLKFDGQSLVSSGSIELPAVCGLALSPEQDVLFVAPGKQVLPLRLADLSPAASPWRNEPLDGGISLCNLSAGGDLLAAGDVEGNVTVTRWNFASGSPDQPTSLWQGSIEPGRSFEVSAVALSPDATLLAMGNVTGRLRVVRLSDGQTILEHESSEDRIQALAIGDTEVGRLLAVSRREGGLQLWLEDGDQLRQLLSWPTPRSITSLRFSPDGKRLAFIVEGERAVRVWDLPKLHQQLSNLGLGWPIQPSP